jgi:hypothetical protein
VSRRRAKTSGSDACQRFASLLDEAGLGLRASLEIERYDAAVPEAWRSRQLLPGARAAIVVASGGRSLWDAFSRSPEFETSPDPLDAYTRRVTEVAASFLEEAGNPSRVLLAFEQRGGVYADFVALGRLAGLGAPSRLGLLLHPVYGPWLSLRAIVLTRASWERAGEQVEFDPCPGCPAPCAVASPGVAARRACVIGPEHAYSEAALAHHMRHVRLP